MATDGLLEKIKVSLNLEDNHDDALLDILITAAVNYTESYQRIVAGYYIDNLITPTTEQAIIMLVSYFYESRDASNGGFHANSVQVGQQIWNTVNMLLQLDRRWQSSIAPTDSDSVDTH